WGRRWARCLGNCGASGTCSVSVWARSECVWAVSVAQVFVWWHGWGASLGEPSGRHGWCPTALGSCPWRTRTRAIHGARVRPSLAAHGSPRATAQHRLLIVVGLRDKPAMVLAEP